MSQPEFVARRFRATVPFYARYRLAYPDELIARVGRAVGLAPGDSVMDLGCGPGLLAIPFARAGMKVVGVDPEPEMLGAARQAADQAGMKIEFLQGSSFDLPAEIGPFKLVTMGRAFHWMDRTETLKALDRLVLASGALALFEDDHPKTAENAWLDGLRAVGARYGADEAAHRRARQQNGYRSHVSYLLESTFPHVIRIGVFLRHTVTADDIVGRAFSLSMLSPERLGAKAEAFEKELRAALAEYAPDGRFTEIAELAALVAMRE